MAFDSKVHLPEHRSELRNQFHASKSVSVMWVQDWQECFYWDEVLF
jgi:hypothetical protein